MSERPPPPQHLHDASTTNALPVAPSLGPVLQAFAPQNGILDARVARISVLAVGVAFVAGLVAQVLTRLIGFITNLAFYGRIGSRMVSPAENHLGLWVLIVPAIGGVIVGFMARYGSKAIRGHGIPEAMEQVLLNQSKVPARMTFLKPLSAAIAIGTGGPFGAEGPIIATGGALGSLVGQVLPTTADERKTLLAAGAAAGMAATFGSPVSAVLLAIELLLFEYRPRSLVPVALATVTAAGVRAMISGTAPVFAMPNLAAPSGEALTFYVFAGLLVGVASVFVTRLVYAVEDAFERLPIHWMWWPALGGLAVGGVGYFAPRTMGVGYDNIDDIVSGRLVGGTLAMLCLAKLVSWSIALGSGTSGGTLAPLFTIGGALGALFTALAGHLFPQFGLDARIGALVGMAAIFAGASRAVLASVVFAFETTRQPLGLLPLLGGCTAAYLASCLMMENSIMTEKIARRGVVVPADYVADIFDRVLVRDTAVRSPVTFDAARTVGDVRAWLASGALGTAHQGYPVLDGSRLVGLLTRRTLVDPNAAGPEATLGSLVVRAPITVRPSEPLRVAVEKMVSEGVGRLLVVDKHGALVGILTRSDVLSAHRHRLDDQKMGTSRLKGMRARVRARFDSVAG